MGSVKFVGKKKRLIKAASRTRLAPFWLVPKIYGLSRARRISPAVLGSKRHWRKSSKIKA